MGNEALQKASTMPGRMDVREETSNRNYRLAKPRGRVWLAQEMESMEQWWVISAEEKQVNRGRT